MIESLSKVRDYISIADLVAAIGVSESTIRRDIDDMERKNLLFRDQGLIIWNQPDKSHLEKVYYRQSQNVGTKKFLAEKASALVLDKDVIFIDTGVTMFHLACAIGYDKSLTVVTNDLSIALELEKRPQINTIVLGGTIRHGTHTLNGEFAVRNLSGLRFTKMFTSAGCIHPDEGFMYYNLQATELRKKIAPLAEKVIVVADASKFSSIGFVTGIRFDQCDLLITDGIPDEFRGKLSPKTELRIFEKD